MKNNYKGYPLLLTGTIDPSVYNNTGNKITDVNERLRQYESAIGRYIKDTVFDPIVFIDNSGFEFPAGKYKAYAERYHKRFEFLKGAILSDEIIEKGKSFGEAYLIHEALEKSELLVGYDFFYKITGRVFLKNSDRIVKTRNKYRNEFITYTKLGWCFTNIFKANREDFLELLDDSYKDCDERVDRLIEMIFYRRLEHSSAEIGCFETYPWFDGVQGANLRPYSGNWIERRIRNVLAGLHVFQLNSATSVLIALYMRLRHMEPFDIG